MFTIAQPKTAQELIARLRETEKISIRSASKDKLEHLRVTSLASDGPVSSETIQEVQRLLNVAHAEASAGQWWYKQTWSI